MANAYKQNVWVVDTDGAFGLTDQVHVIGVLLISDGSNAATLSLKCDGTSGTVIYQSAIAASTTIPTFHEVCFSAKALAADIGGTGAKAYIYFK